MVSEIYSIGHSNLSIDEFISLLKNYKIDLIVDVRGHPNSKTFPHFNQNPLKEKLLEKGIKYIYLGKKLGGKQRIDFKGYTKTEDYKEGTELLKKAVRHGRKAAIMCAEADYRKCHRRFICQTLIEQGYEVNQIDSKQAKSKINPVEQKTLSIETNNLKNLEIYTIGFSKKSLEEFVKLIKNKGIKKIVDVRLRNSSQLAGFAKSQDLKFLLERFLGIKYDHKLTLAPTDEILNDYRKDKDWEKYVARFSELIKKRKIEDLFNDLFSRGDICFLCSEDSPKQCHRRLIAEYYRNKFPELEIIHLKKSDLKKK